MAQAVDLVHNGPVMEYADCIIVGTGPAGLGAAFTLLEHNAGMKVLLIDRSGTSTGGLRNDCKMNFTFPVGFPTENWTQAQAEIYLDLVKRHLDAPIMKRHNLAKYRSRAERLGVSLLEIDQCHLGTDGGLQLIERLISRLETMGAHLALREEVTEVAAEEQLVRTERRSIRYEHAVIAPGRQGFKFLQNLMDGMGVSYVDHIVDVGLRVETREEHFPIVRDYYDPKFLFPDKVRTFCTNSGNAHVVKERYTSRHDSPYFSVNGHAYANRGRPNGLANFAMLKTIKLTEPVVSGQEYAENLGLQAMLMGGGQPIMQRVGDFRLDKRSKRSTFNDDLFDFEPTLPGCTPGDISLSIPAKILRGIWRSMKYLDTIVPGLLHPGTIMYYPEIKLYANKPAFLDQHFRVHDNLYFAGDGAGVSRGITAAWASGIRAAEGILGADKTDSGGSDGT